MEIHYYHYSLCRNWFAVYRGIVSGIAPGFTAYEGHWPGGTLYVKIINEDRLDMIFGFNGDAAACHEAVRQLIKQPAHPSSLDAKENQL